MEICSLVNYDKYQDINQQTNQQVTNNQPSNNHQITTIEEYKEDKEGKKKNIEGQKRFAPPTKDEVKAYCDESGYNVDADNFIDFYESKGWMVGKNKMKNWKAAVRR